MSFQSFGTSFQTCQDERMATRTRRSQRRTEALSRERIVEAAVELLDAVGEGGLTFRVLTERLATGPGAIYWHVANKGELLAAATDAVVAAALAVEPRVLRAAAGRIRAVALGLFGAIDEHPWLAAQLSASSWQATTPRIFESIGRQVRALGVPEGTGSPRPRRWCTTSSAPPARTPRTSALPAGADRAEFLDAVSRPGRSSTPTTTRSPGPSRTRCATTTTASSSSPASPRPRGHHRPPPAWSN